ETVWTEGPRAQAPSHRRAGDKQDRRLLQERRHRQGEPGQNEESLLFLFFISLLPAPKEHDQAQHDQRIRLVLEAKKPELRRESQDQRPEPRHARGPRPRLKKPVKSIERQQIGQHANALEDAARGKREGGGSVQK